jgi:hypothetical protein
MNEDFVVNNKPLKMPLQADTMLSVYFEKIVWESPRILKDRLEHAQSLQFHGQRCVRLDSDLP